MTTPIVLNILALPLVFATQVFFRHRLNALGIDLPTQTEFALGPTPLQLLGVLLLTSVLIRRFGATRLTRMWEVAAISICGAVVAYLALAVWMAFPSGPVELSQAV